MTVTAARRTRKAAATTAAPQTYTIHSLDEVEIDTRVIRTTALNEDEARELTDQIRRTTVRLWLLVTEAHDRKAHLAMGYDTWADYARAELNMSESRSYQYLDTGHVMKALASGGVDIENVGVPPTRVVARVKDNLTEIRKLAKEAAKLTDGTEAQVIDERLRELARQPRKGKLTVTSPEIAVPAAGPANEGGRGESAAEAMVTCPACKGEGKVARSLAGTLRDLMRQLRSP